MPALDRDSTTRLPVDDEFDEIIEYVPRGGEPDQHEADAWAEAQGRADELRKDNDDRFRIGAARALARLKRQDGRLQDELTMFSGEVARSRGRLHDKIKWLEVGLDAIARDRREAGLGGFFDIPGVGRWQTRETKPGWDIDMSAANKEALLKFFEGDEAAAEIGVVEEQLVIKGDALRQFLDDLAAKTDGDYTELLPPGVTRRAVTIGVSYDLDR